MKNTNAHIKTSLGSEMPIFPLFRSVLPRVGRRYGRPRVKTVPEKHLRTQVSRKKREAAADMPRFPNADWSPASPQKLNPGGISPTVGIHAANQTRPCACRLLASRQGNTEVSGKGKEVSIKDEALSNRRDSQAAN